MRGLEEEEEAAEKEDAFRAERQIRERQAQRNQARSQGQPQRQPQRQPGTTQGQRTPAFPQGSQRQISQSGGPRPAGAGQIQQYASRPVSQTGGQRPAAAAQGQRQAAQPRRSALSEDQNYVVRGPVAGDGEFAGTSGRVNRTARPQAQSGGDDDFQIIDID